MTPADEHKRTVGFAAVERYVRSNACVGLGTGSTARFAVEAVGARVAGGEDIVAVATSAATELQCHELGIPLVALGERDIDVAIDGADEVAADWSLTKGGGGAHFREKAVALAARAFVVIVTPEKLVEKLGAFPTPVEVVPFTLAVVTRAIDRLYPGARVKQRCAADARPFVTDNGNAILDCAFGAIDDPAALDAALRGIHGVVATGLFPAALTAAVLVGSPAGVRELQR
ncbi:MAG: ribose 5-phosphate isomerase [Candidatus Eremiobacteraeota bacterium]|jgi:ribose 5-phosphate isomerase A|nr:ribose 5-phosphate isomerase [Candidatus Eremiobacteraeota bacterium]